MELGAHFLLIHARLHKFLHVHPVALRSRNTPSRYMWLLDESLIRDDLHLVSDGGTGERKIPLLDDVLRPDRDTGRDKLIDDRDEKLALARIHNCESIALFTEEC